MRPYKNIISVKKTIFILAIVSTLLVSAKGTLSRKAIGNGYHQYNVERVDTLHKVAFNDSAFETIIEDVVTTINYAELSESKILFVTTINGNTDSLLVSEPQYLRERGVKFNFTGFKYYKGKAVVIQKEVCDVYCTKQDSAIVQTYRYIWNTLPRSHTPIYWEIAVHNNDYRISGPLIQYLHEKTYRRLVKSATSPKQE